MSKNTKYQYFVEGDTEKKLIEVLKTNSMIISGTVNIFNVIQKEFSTALLANLSKDTVVILVFDTDTNDDAKLRKNLQTLKKHPSVREYFCILQVKNLEDELVRATDVHDIRDLIGSKSESDFKRDWLREKRLIEKLRNHNFNYNVFWSSKADPPFSDIDNNAFRVKKQGSSMS